MEVRRPMPAFGAVILVVLAYLAGSIPFGVLVARLTGAPDPRSTGSGRTGGTNALRAMGRQRAALVVIGDILKGSLPVLAARLLTGGDPALEAACGVAAVVGAARSVFLGFHGGRGVATGVGTMLVIQPLAVLLAAPVFVIVILVTRYVSLGSLLGSAAMIPAVALVFAVVNGTVPAAYLIYAVVGVGIVWLAHADNIERLLHGTERKFDLGLLSGRGGSGS
jgi:glycerol-3-phosphate acyltransferase PlsY